MGTGTCKSQTGICTCKFRAPLSLTAVPEEVQGSIKGLGFLFPRNWNEQTNFQPCPTATHGTPPHKANLELFWKKIQEIFDRREEKHQMGPEWAGSHSSVPSLGKRHQGLISWNHRVLKAGKDLQGQVQPSTHIHH